MLIKRIDIVFGALLSMSTVVHSMEEVVQPLSLQDLARLKWPIRRYHEKFNDFWFPEELLRDPIAKRLAVSSQEVKMEALCKMCDLDTLEKRYKAACCLAAGAQEGLASVLANAVSQNLSNFVATLSYFEPDPNAKKMNARTERTVLKVGGMIQTSFSEHIPLFFKAESKEMANWLWMLGANYAIRGGKDGGTVLHWLCTCPPEDPQKATELLKFYLNRQIDPNAQDVLGYTALHCVALNYSWYSHEIAIPFAQLLLLAGADPLQKDNKGTTFKDLLLEEAWGVQGETRKKLREYVESLAKGDSVAVLEVLFKLI